MQTKSLSISLDRKYVVKKIDVGFDFRIIKVRDCHGFWIFCGLILVSSWPEPLLQVENDLGASWKWPWCIFSIFFQNEILASTFSRVYNITYLRLLILHFLRKGLSFFFLEEGWGHRFLSPFWHFYTSAKRMWQPVPSDMGDGIFTLETSRRPHYDQDCSFRVKFSENEVCFSWKVKVKMACEVL